MSNPLIQAVAQRLHCTDEEAREALHAYARRLRADLADTDHVEVEGLGTFWQEEGQLRFQAAADLEAAVAPHLAGLGALPLHGSVPTLSQPDVAAPTAAPSTAPPDQVQKEDAVDTSTSAEEVAATADREGVPPPLEKIETPAPSPEQEQEERGASATAEPASHPADDQPEETAPPSEDQDVEDTQTASDAQDNVAPAVPDSPDESAATPGPDDATPEQAAAAAAAASSQAEPASPGASDAPRTAKPVSTASDAEAAPPRRARSGRSKSRSSSRTGLTALAAIVLIAAGVTAWFFLRPAPPAADDAPVVIAAPDTIDTDTSTALVDTSAAAPPAPEPPALQPAEGGFTIVVASELDPAVADERVASYQEIAGSTTPVGIIEGTADGRMRYRVGIGQFETETAARATLDRLGERLPSDAWILSL